MPPWCGALPPLGCLGIAGVNFTDTAANVTTLLARPGASLALPDRDPGQQPLAAASAEFTGGRPLAAALRTQKSVHVSFFDLVGQAH